MSFKVIHEDYKTLGLAFLVSTLTFLLFRKHLKRISNRNPGRKTIRDIPPIKTFPFWTPPIIEGLAALYRLFNTGAKASFELWASTNYSPLAKLTAVNFQNVVFITHPELIKKSLGSSDSEFIEKPKFFYDKLLTTIIQDGLFGAKLSVWKAHRKILNKLFTFGMLQSQLKIVDKCAQQLITELSTINSSVIKGEHFYPVIYSTTLKLILEILMSTEIVAEKGVEEFADKFRILKSLTPYRLLHPFYMIDFIWKRSSKGKVQQECISYFENYFDDGIEKVIGKVGDKRTQECGAVEHMHINNMEKKEIRDEIATLIAAGHETTDVTLHLLMQHLGEHLDIQKRCQEEIDLVLNSNHSMTMDDLANLKYLEQCILETLRLTPPVPAFGRELNEQVELDNVFLEKGTILIFCPWIIHRHPDYYPDAEKFDPGRFTQEKVQARHPYSFMPFSFGPRNCIGWKLAMMELKTITSWILKHYNIRTNDKLTDVKLTFEVTLLPNRKFDLWLEKRN